MRAYVARRVLSGTAVVVALLVFVFFATHYIGDPVELLVDRELSTDADRQALIEANGWDQPVWVQFWNFMRDAARGDLGESIFEHRSATAVVLDRIPATLQLTFTAMAFTFAVSLALAVIAARRPGSWIETAITTVCTALASIASFWLALALIFVLAVELALLPTSGYGFGKPLILPVLALSAPAIGQITQVLHASLTNEFRQPYVNTARSKGLPEHAVVGRHVLRNTAVVTITLVGAMLATLINGAVLIESIFAWPGVGQLGLQAVQRRDLPVLMAVVFYVGVTVTIINLLVDIAYIYLDPRIRLR